MDFSTEITTFKSEDEGIDLHQCVLDITKKISLLRKDVKDHMDSHYVQLQSVMSFNTTLHAEAGKLLENVKDLQLRLDTQMKREVATLTVELKQMKDNLEESTILLDQVNKLLIIDTELSSVHSEPKKLTYLQTMKHLDVAQKYLNQECSDIEYLDIYKTISETISLWNSEYYKEVCKAWEDSVNITCPEMAGNNKAALLNVCLDRAAIQDILMALSLLGEVIRRISIFANSLYKNIIVPIVERHSTATVDTKSSSIVLKVSSKVKSDVDSKESSPDYGQVLRNLTTVFHFLRDNLDFEIESGNKFLKEVGGYIGEDLTSLLDEKCLTHTIPRKRQDLEAFSVVVQEILTLDSLLKDMQFLESSNKALLKYSGSVDELFLNKTIGIYLDTARTIMKKDIQDMKELVPEEIKDVEPSQNTSQRASFVLDQIGLGLFQFPRCYISKSAEELILLVKEILTEIVTDRQMTSESVIKMFSTARDMFMGYKQAYVYHKKNIDSIPQQAALLHNNLMFLAHEAMTLHLDFRSQYPSSLVQNMAHFVDLVNPLRTSATKILDQQVKKQQKIIVDTVNKTGLTALSDCEKLNESSKKYLKQCLYQLSFLKNIWYHILPSNVYSRIMGHLCHAFFDEIINKVLTIKDITADTTTELAIVFGSIQEDVPSLFQEPKEIHRYVKNWTKFNELIYVLSGTLTGIEERWADGKGPLANEFTPMQLKHLIKAIFQTSDRRAAVIASIN